MPEIDINGLDGLQKAFMSMVNDFPEEKRKLMEQVGDTLVNHIKPLTPVNVHPPPNYKHTPGQLRESVRKKIRGNYAVVKSGERYAHLVEAGHVIANRKAQSSKVHKKGKNKGDFKLVAQPLGFVKGVWMFKRGTEAAMPKIKRLVDDFVKRVTDK